MKIIITASLVALAAITSCGTSTIQDVSGAKSSAAKSKIIEIPLTIVALDPSIPAAGATAAYLNLDFNHKFATISVPTCPRGAMCIWAGPSYTASIISDEIQVTDEQAHCVVRVIHASTDRRPVDGSLVDIRIFDHSKNACRQAERKYVTQVILVTKTSSRGGASATSSTFKSEKSISGKAAAK